MSILRELGINFSKEPAEVVETRKLIKESEEKREALIQALAQEESRILMSNTDHFLKIGEYVYENYDKVKAGGFGSEIEESYNFIKSNEEKLNEIKKKMDDVKQRYDDEIEILKLNLPSVEPEKPEKPEVEENVAFCPNCGAKNDKGANFCGSCGGQI